MQHGIKYEHWRKAVVPFVLTDKKKEISLLSVIWPCIMLMFSRVGVAYVNYIKMISVRYGSDMTCPISYTEKLPVFTLNPSEQVSPLIVWQSLHIKRDYVMVAQAKRFPLLSITK